MKVRYTDTASRELDEAIAFLNEFAPSVAGQFAEAIEKAIAELTESILGTTNRHGGCASQVCAPIPILHLLFGRE